MLKPKISICIPTYNRRVYLRETLESLITQAHDKNAMFIEICISDNASNDGTEELISEIQKLTSIKIIYSRNETNIGADANYLKSVELASAEYCWFMGSDDCAMPGSIDTLLTEISEGCDIYLFNRVECNLYMKPIRSSYWLDEDTPKRWYDLADPSQFTNYTKAAQSIGALFSYLSCIVFRREKWRNVRVDPDFIGSGYSHVYMLMSFISTGCILKYLPIHLVMSRGGNDSFLEIRSSGYVDRIMLDINGYYLVANKIFEKNKIYRNGIFNALHAERPALKTLMYLRYKSRNDQWKKIKLAFSQCGYSKSIILIVNFSSPIISAVVRLRNLIVFFK